MRSLWESLCSPLSENEKTNNRTRPGVIADGIVVLADSLLLESDIVCLRDEMWFAGWMRLPRYPSTSPVLPTSDFFSHLLRHICIFFFTVFSSRNSRAASGCFNTRRLCEVRLEGKPADPGGKVMEGLLVMTTGSADRYQLCRALTVTHSAAN